MMRILLVKTSSLGDVVHNLPIATDIAHAISGAAIDWVVEEAFAEIPTMHPAVRSVVAVAIRRWRARLGHSTTWREMRAFVEQVRRERYDFVIDTQGLLKSAIITRIAHGQRFGLGWRASREPLFPFYHQTFDVSRALHAVERNRRLAAAALTYVPPLRVDYGLRVSPQEFGWLPKNPYAVLIHATSASTKLWAEANWIELGTTLTQRGLCCVVPWGSAHERSRSQRIQSAIPGAAMPPALSIHAMASLLAGARCVVGVDTGLLHLAGALGVPTVGIFKATAPAATGLHGCARAANLGGVGRCPTVEAVIHAVNALMT